MAGRVMSRVIERSAHARFMRRAVALARRGMNARAGGPFGAVVVRRGAIVGEGWNRVVATGDPCPMCLAAAYWARIDRIFYGFTIDDAARIGFDDRLIYRQLAKPGDRRTMPAIRLLATQARALLREYAATPRRARY